MRRQESCSLRAATGGFTLIEVLVALLILGIMSALGYGTYRQARISAERTEEALKRSREIEYGMRVLVMDFAQIVPRPVRDPLGQTRVPALHGFSGNGTTAGTAGSGFLSASAASSTRNEAPMFRAARATDSGLPPTPTHAVRCPDSVGGKTL